MSAEERSSRGISTAATAAAAGHRVDRPVEGEDGADAADDLDLDVGRIGTEAGKGNDNEAANPDAATVAAAASKPVPGSRRPHRKSRRGCVPCKQRRIKCDEGKPQCAKCIHYSTPCSFLQTQPPVNAKRSTNSDSTRPSESYSQSSTPAAGTPTHQSSPYGHPSGTSLTHQLQNGANSFSLSDLELFLNFTTSTYLTIPPVELWPVAIPGLAFQHAFIAHEIIALSALHLARLQPSRRSFLLQEAHRHHELCLGGFQEMLRDINEHTYHPSSMGAALITVYAFASNTGNLFLHDPMDKAADSSRIELVQLLRGQRAIIQAGRPWLSSGPMWRQAQPWAVRNQEEQPLPSDAANLVTLCPLVSPRLPAPAGLSPQSTQYPASPTPGFSSSAFDPELETLAATLGLINTMFAVTNPENNNNISDAEGALGLLSQLPMEYLTMVQRHEPRALVLLAHFCILLKRAGGYWWLEGSAEKLLGIVKVCLAPEWWGWCRWPAREVGLV